MSAGPCRYAFIIVSYNTLVLTRAAIRSIKIHACGLPCEIILVDNHSADGSGPVLQREFPDLKVLALDQNYGFAAANNAGAKLTRAEWLILMNSDAEILPDTLPQIEILLQWSPPMDVLGGQLLNSDATLQRSVTLQGRNRRFEHAHQDKELMEVPGLVGAFMVIRRTSWEQLGGMDTGFFFYFEETDFCRRARHTGFRVGWSPRIRVLHHRGSSVGEVNLNARVEYWRSRYYYWSKDQHPAVYYVRRGWVAASLVFNILGNFLGCLVTVFQSPKIRNRLRTYVHLLAWHLRGCPSAWGLKRPNSSHAQHRSV